MFDALLKQVGNLARESRSAYMQGRYELDDRALHALDVLELPYDASFETVKQRYRELAKTMHPDTQNATNTEGFLRIKEAYDVLKSFFKSKESHE